jgi:hypothetical protein
MTLGAARGLSSRLFLPSDIALPASIPCVRASIDAGAWRTLAQRSRVLFLAIRSGSGTVSTRRNRIGPRARDGSTTTPPWVISILPAPTRRRAACRVRSMCAASTSSNTIRQASDGQIVALRARAASSETSVVSSWASTESSVIALQAREHDGPDDDDGNERPHTRHSPIMSMRCRRLSSRRGRQRKRAAACSKRRRAGSVFSVSPRTKAATSASTQSSSRTRSRSWLFLRACA